MENMFDEITSKSKSEMKNMKFLSKPQAGYKIKKTSTHYIHSKKAKNDCRHLIRKKEYRKIF